MSKVPFYPDPSLTKAHKDAFMELSRRIDAVDSKVEEVTVSVSSSIPNITVPEAVASEGTYTTVKVDDVVVGTKGVLNLKAEAPIILSGVDNLSTSEVDVTVSIDPAALESSYIHRQDIPSSVWTISHPLKRPVNVATYKLDGSRILGNEDDNQYDTVVVTFSGGFSGYAVVS
jgi:hypothetical protein